MSLAMTMQAKDWTDDLTELNPDVIDSVVYIPSTLYGPKTLRSYWIHYHQPLQHDAPELGTLPLRALLTIHHKDDFLNKMTQVNIGGYDLDESFGRYPNYYADYMFGISSGELAGRYKGNLLQPEHRYFGESCPMAPWATLGYCEAKEAAADFHALIEAMKKVFKGKWAVSGVSKGGTTTAIQQAFYPQDADCFVPYSGPFLGIVGDTRMQERWMTESWTPELREAMLHIQKEILHRPAIYQMYRRYYQWGPEYDRWDDLLRCFMLNAVGLLDNSLHAYSSQETVGKIFTSNQQRLEREGLSEYNDEMLLYMVVNGFHLLDEDYDQWYATNFETKRNAKALDRMLTSGHTYVRRVPLPVFGISESEWDYSSVGYYYQASHELGYFDLKWDYFYDTQAEVDSVNALWHSQTDNVLSLGFHLFDSVEFNPELMDYVRTQTANAQGKILFIYGNDDMWTGACMDEDCINGQNVRQYILSEQNHGVCINDVADQELRDELWAFTDDIFDPSTESIAKTLTDATSPAVYYDLFGRRLNPNDLRSKIVIQAFGAIAR